MYSIDMKIIIKVLILVILMGINSYGNQSNSCQGMGGNGGGDWSVTIPVPRDPNEMAGPAGFGGEKRYVMPDTTLEYTVYFENVRTAMAAAQEIFIDANMSKYLDTNSFEFGELELAGQTIADLRGRKQGEALVPLKGRSDFVKVVVTFQNGHLRLYMRSYDKTRPKNGYWPEDDYDGFLKPNDDTGRGEGHFTFRIKVKTRDELAEYTEPEMVITAMAEIIFDQNEMIPTDPAWSNTIFDDRPLPVTETDIADGAEISAETTSVQWRDGGGAESFDVTFKEVDENGNVLDTWRLTNLTQPFCHLPMELKSGGRYRWQIISRNEKGTTASAEMSFSVESEGEILQLRPGWNLLALTRELTEDEEAELLSRHPFVFDIENHSYIQTTLLWPGLGFWMFSRKADKITLKGDELLDWTLTKPDIPGWHLMGMAADNAIPSWAGSVWEWNGRRFTEPSSTELLKRGHAYWIYLPNDR